MGCDMGSVNEPVPYCKPKCKEFKLVTCLDRVEAQCVRCNLRHQITLANGVINVHQEERVESR